MFAFLSVEGSLARRAVSLAEALKGVLGFKDLWQLREVGVMANAMIFAGIKVWFLMPLAIYYHHKPFWPWLITISLMLAEIPGIWRAKCNFNLGSIGAQLAQKEMERETKGQEVLECHRKSQPYARQVWWCTLFHNVLTFSLSGLGGLLVGKMNGWFMRAWEKHHTSGRKAKQAADIVAA